MRIWRIFRRWYNCRYLRKARSGYPDYILKEFGWTRKDLGLKWLI